MTPADTQVTPVATPPPPPPSRPPRLTYRVTGAAAQARLVPVLQEMVEVDWHPASPSSHDADADGLHPPVPLDFVWETHVPRQDKQQHDGARLLNRLSNTSILENKAHFANLQALMSSYSKSAPPTLETVVVRAGEAQAWLDARRRKQRLRQRSESVANEKEEGSEEEWWILKATGANGGGDVYLMPPSRASVPASLSLHPDEPYVIQRYLTRPLLFENKYKFHYRVYALLRVAAADKEKEGKEEGCVEKGACSFQPWLYRHAFILRAANPYPLDTDGDDEVNDKTTHLTNLSLNKGEPDYPGQIPVDLAKEHPELFEQLKGQWAAVVEAAAPFLRVQASPHHFEFFGLDFLLARPPAVPGEAANADATPLAHLLEMNRLPGLQSSSQNKAKEDVLYNDMMRDLLRLCVLPPLLGMPAAATSGGWERVEAGAGGRMPVVLDSREPYKNVLRWAMHLRGNKKREEAKSLNDKNQK